LDREEARRRERGREKERERERRGRLKEERCNCSFLSPSPHDAIAKRVALDRGAVKNTFCVGAWGGVGWGGTNTEIISHSHNALRTKDGTTPKMILQRLNL
jgi:hypothetical protein